MVMWQNASYVFFRELARTPSAGPAGRDADAPLTPGRSLAVDPGHHALGTPIYVSAGDMKHVDKAGTFNRLMIAQDVGSAIKGPERGDIYFGSGDAAGTLAGVTKHAGKFIVLLPNETPARAEARASQLRRSPAMSRIRPEVRRRPVAAVTADEAALWEHATRTLDPVKAKPRVVAARPRRLSPRRAPTQASQPAPASRRRTAASRAPSAVASAKASHAPPRRSPTSTAARPAASPPAGSRSTRASICTGAPARCPCAPARLPARRPRRGLKTVLVITGKGGEEPAERLSAAPSASDSAACCAATFPPGSRSPNCARSCSSYTQAGVRHGGAGALYVQLRRARE